MRKAALLFNPDSGGSRKRRRELDSAVAILSNGGVEAKLVLTDSREHATAEARAQLAAGCDAIFACGGDGTIHNVMQVLANSPTALGILPAGTANALAHDLGIPRNIPDAARAALRFRTRRVALGKVSYTALEGQALTRYFVVAAGVGADAHLFYKLHSGSKQSMGMMAYYTKTLNLWFTYNMRRFAAEWEDDSGSVKKASLTEMMAVRIRDFGGIVHEMAPGAALERNDMRLILARTGSRMTYLSYVARCLLRRSWAVPGIDLEFSTRVRCESGESHENVYVEADGELIGKLPAEFTVVPDALTLLAP